MTKFLPNQIYKYNNYRFDQNYYNKNSENDLYTFREFCELMRKLCSECGFEFKERTNSYKKNPEVVEIEIFT